MVWSALLISIATCLGLGSILVWFFQRWVQRKYPSNKEKVDFLKTYNDAQYVQFQLTDQLKKMVEKETDKFQEILLQRELDHKKKEDMYLRKINELEDEIERLKKRIMELENINNKKS